MRATKCFIETFSNKSDDSERLDISFANQEDTGTKHARFVFRKRGVAVEALMSEREVDRISRYLVFFFLGSKSSDVEVLTDDREDDAQLRLSRTNWGGEYTEGIQFTFCRGFDEWDLGFDARECKRMIKFFDLILPMMR